MSGSPTKVAAWHSGACWPAFQSRCWSERLQHQDRERGQGEHDRVRLSLPRSRLGPRATSISEIAAAVFLRVAVEQLPVVARPWNPDAVAVAGHRREVADDAPEVARPPRPTPPPHHPL